MIGTRNSAAVSPHGICAAPASITVVIGLWRRWTGWLVASVVHNAREEFFSSTREFMNGLFGRTVFSRPFGARWQRIDRRVAGKPGRRQWAESVRLRRVRSLGALIEAITMVPIPIPIPIPWDKCIRSE